MNVHPVESSCIVVVRKQASLAIAWMYIQASLTAVWFKKAGESSFCVDVHPGDCKCCVVVRKQAILCIAWMYIQASVAVVWL